MSITAPAKACTVNPLKLSPALGGAMAFLGIERTLPLFHGSQGCTAFALVLLVRHFREAIPLQTTAMNELTTILGGAENIEQAIGTIRDRAAPRLIGLCSTALTETRGEDVEGDLSIIRQRHPEWADLEIVYASTPDTLGSLETGWGRTVTAIVNTLVPKATETETRSLRQVNLLTASHLTPADVEELRDIIEAFGLRSIMLPDLSMSLDGHVPSGYVPTSLGGTTLNDIRRMGTSVLTLAVGEHMRPAAAALAERTGVPYRLIDTATGLDGSDAFAGALMEAGGVPSERIRRDRSRLIDAMLDGHFVFENRRIAVAGEPDFVRAYSALAVGMGATVAVAVASTGSATLAGIRAERTLVGDLEDLERAAAPVDLIIASSNAHDTAARLGVPLMRAGFPVFDRIGAPQSTTVGYRGTRALIFDIGNRLMEHAKADATHTLKQEDRRHDAAEAC
jgi:nitrogenase molybdenum-iron cofactor biosynthesis protein NifN